MTAEINKAVERLTKHVQAFQEAAPRSRHLDDVSTVLSELSRLREENELLKGEADEHALFDAETDVAFKDLDATIDDLKEQVATLTRERDEAIKALRPFAEFAERIPDAVPGTVNVHAAFQQPWADKAMAYVYEFRRAATLSRQSKEGGEHG